MLPSIYNDCWKFFFEKINKIAGFDCAFLSNSVSEVCSQVCLLLLVVSSLLLWSYNHQPLSLAEHKHHKNGWLPAWLFKCPNICPSAPLQSPWQWISDDKIGRIRGAWRWLLKIALDIRDSSLNNCFFVCKLNKSDITGCWNLIALNTQKSFFFPLL